MLGSMTGLEIISVIRYRAHRVRANSPVHTCVNRHSEMFKILPKVIPRINGGSLEALTVCTGMEGQTFKQMVISNAQTEAFGTWYFGKQKQYESGKLS